MATAKELGHTKQPNDIDRIVGGNLRAIRREKGLTQVELANALDLTFQQIQKYEKGTNRVVAGRFPGFAEALQCDIDDFYEGVDTSFDNESPTQRESAKELVKLKDVKRILIRQIERSKSVDVLTALSMMLNTLEADRSESKKKSCA